MFAIFQIRHFRINLKRTRYQLHFRRYIHLTRGEHLHQYPASGRNILHRFGQLAAPRIRIQLIT